MGLETSKQHRRVRRSVRYEPDPNADSRGSRTTVTFSANSSQTFTHLMLIVSALDDSGVSQSFTLNFNGDTGVNYAFRNTLNVNGTPGGSASAASSAIQAGLEGGTAGGSQIFIPAYRGSLGKTITGTANSFTAAAAVLAGQYGGSWNKCCRNHKHFYSPHTVISSRVLCSVCTECSSTLRPAKKRMNDYRNRSR